MPQEPYPTIAQAVDLFLAAPEQDPLATPETHRTYRTALRAFLRFLEESNEAPSPTQTTDSLGVGVLRAFYVWLLEQEPEHAPGEKLSDATVATYLAAVTSLLRFLELRLGDESKLTFTVEQARDRLGEVPIGRVVRRPPGRMPLVITYYDKLPLPAGEGPRQAKRRLDILRNRAILHVLYSTGCRISEVAALNRADVEDGHADEALIVSRKGKRREMKERYVYFTPEARAAIRTYLAARGDQVSALFVSHRAKDPGRRRRLSARSIWQVVKEAGRAVGVPEVMPHHFRHYRGSVLLEQGLSLAQVQEVLGHESVDTTRRTYIHLDQGKLKADVLAHSPSPAELERKLKGASGRDGGDLA